MIRRLARRIAGSFSLGLASQALAFVAGVLVIRALDKSSYVEYSLSGALVGAVLVVSDSGIASTFVATAAKAEHAGRFTALLSAALRWRRVVWGTAIVPTLALLMYLLLRAGSPVWTAVGISLLTAALSYNSLSLALIGIDYQLSGRFKALQGLETLNNGSRAVLIGLGLLLGVQGIFYYLVVALVLGVLQVRWMTRRVRERHERVEATREDRRVFGRAVRSTLVATGFLIVGEQLVNLIIVQRGNPLAVADLAALGRFGLAFGVINVVAGNLAVPYIARAGETVGGVVRRASAVVGAYAAVSVAYVVGVLLFEPLLLQILGPQYRHLSLELVVVTASTALANFAVYGVGIVIHARGWVGHSWTYGPFLGLWVVYAALFADVSTTLGAALLAASLTVPLLLSQAVRIGAGIRALHRASAVPAEQTPLTPA